MIFSPGDIIRVDFPGHAWHGKTVEVVRDEAEFELGHPESGASLLARVIFVRGPGAPRPIGLGPEHIDGTLEAQKRRRSERDEPEGRQGDLGL